MKNIKAYFLVLFFLSFLLTSVIVAWASISNIEILPNLNISIFSPYKIKADISGEPTSATVELKGVTTQSPNPDCWDYYIDGTCDSAPVTKNMTYNSSSGKWESQNIYPDDIYPEIYFSKSNVTWYNAPSNKIMNRNSYQLFNFNNPFDMVEGMSFFVEINAAPRSTTNSADLQVYLVAKDTNVSFFNSNWLSDPKVSLIGTISRNDAYNHSHTANSSHHLVSLKTDASGLVNGLDISDNFWIVVYNSSPNNARGWDLRYHSTSVSGCSDLGRWYQGSQSGWTTTAMSGCPDAHVHVARRIEGTNMTVQDGIEAKITANYVSGGPSISTSTFYFIPVPNLAPNSTSFTNPVISGSYDQDITVSWNPATDPNNDPLLYSIYLLNSEGRVISTLASNTTSTSFIWDIDSINNGTYSLKGLITEDITQSPLSKEFLLGGNFTINKTEPIYSLNSIALNSNNASSTLAKAGNIITLLFTSTGTTTPNVTFYSGGNPVNGSVSINPTIGSSFNATYTVNVNDTSGPITFDISDNNLDQIYNNTTDNSNVLVDVVIPSAVTASSSAGTYSTGQSVSLSTSVGDYIKYTTNGTSPTCSTGSLYSSALSINSPTVIKAIACDLAGNYSEVVTLEYLFQHTITFDGNSGSGHNPSSRLVNYGATTTLPTEPSKTGYTFTGWNTQANGLGDPFTATTTVFSNDTVYAIWSINNYSLAYNGSSNTGGTVPSTANYNYNTVATVAAQGDLLKGGYSFYGWNTQADGGGISYSPGDSITMTASLTLYAQWLQNDQCTVTFNGNGGSGHTPGTRVFDCTLHSSLSAASSSLPSSPTRTGYDFVNWNLQADGLGDTFTATSTISTSTTVYAQWSGSEYIINFDAQGGVVSPTSTVVTYNSAVGSLPIPTKSNYSFVGWNSQVGGSGAYYSSSTVYSIAGDTTVYAQWSGNNYVINFDAQGGVVSSSSKAVIYGQAVGALPTPTRSNYTFLGWNTATDGSGSSYSSGSNYLVGGNLTLYAIWQGNSYLISFNTQGGTVSSTTKSVIYNEAIGELPTPVKSGYTFVGWYREANMVGGLFTAATIYNLGENVVLVASWSANNYLITFDNQGGQSPTSSKAVVYNSAIGTLPTPTKDGYSFSSWNTQADGLGSVYLAGNTYQIAVNITLYAQYNALPQEESSSTGSAVSLPSGVGPGVRDAVAFQNVIGATINAGEVDNSGVNVLTYITNRNNFIAPQSSANWSLADHQFVINNLDLYNNQVTLIFYSNPKVVVLGKGGVSRVDLDEDGIDDIEVLFADLYVNRAEISIKSLSEERSLEQASVEVVDRVVKINNQSMYNRLKGKILLKTEDSGRAYYISPDKLEMYYLGRPADAFRVMREQGVGITNSDLAKILKPNDKVNNKINQAFSQRHSGKIFIQVQEKGEAWYVDTNKNTRHYLGRPGDAFNIMKILGLGISNQDFNMLIQ